MSPIAFADIDTQIDFIEPQGKLYAPGAEDIKKNLERLYAFARAQGIPIVSSVDAHAADDAEFRQFPPHCLRGTEGQRKVAEARSGQEVFVAQGALSFPDPRRHHVVIEKQDFPVFTNPVAERVFAATGADTVYVFGVVTEVCVRAAALGLRERGYGVRLIADAIWPITRAGGDKAIEEMRAAGCELVTTAEVLALAPVSSGRAQTPMKLEQIEIVEDKTQGSRCDEGFLRVRRLRLRNHYNDGSSSATYACDIVKRRDIDAVAVALWESRIEAGRRRVYVALRSGIRAPIYLRKNDPDQGRPEPVFTAIYEIVAGVLEPHDQGPAGVLARAVAEVHEEAGITVTPAEIALLGGPFFPSPGITPEKVYLTACEGRIGVREEPKGDGSVMEEGASIELLELGDAIARCRRGAIPDAKTEIALLRLADRIGFISQLDCFRDELPEAWRARFRAPGLEGS